MFQLDQPAAAVLRFAKIVKSHPAHHAYDVVFMDDGSLASGVQKLETHTSNNAGTVDMHRVDQNPDDPWSGEFQSTKDQTKRDQIAVVAMVGVTPVIIGTLPLNVSQMNFPDTVPNLHLDRHASDIVHSKEDNGDWCIRHPSGAYLLFTVGGRVPDFSNLDYDQIFNLTRNATNFPDCHIYTYQITSGPKPKYTYAKAGFTADGSITIAASEFVSIKAEEFDITNNAGRDFLVTAHDNIKGVANNHDVSFTAGENMLLTAGYDFTGSAGLEMVLTAGGNMTLTATEIHLN